MIEKVEVVMYPYLVIFMAIWVLGGCTGQGAKNQAPHPLRIVENWTGDYPVSALDRLPKGQRNTAVGWLDESHFSSVWEAFRPGSAVPRVDFSRHLVVFVRNTEFYNRTHIAQVKVIDGVAEVIAMETMSAIPIQDRVAIALVVIPRDEIKTLRLGSFEIKVR